MRPRPVVFLVGPTAAGKTRLSIALARALRGEIISCDSMQLYRGAAILSQAPTVSDRKRARHHLVGVCDPRTECSVALYRAKAVRAIRAVVRRGRVPLVVGGSGLYAKALIDGLFPSPPADTAFRKRMERLAKRAGSLTLHKRLAKIDLVSATRIHPNDTRRIIRALELYHATGKTMTELAARTRGLKDECRVIIVGLGLPRPKLYRRIDERVEEMFASGAVSEAKRLSAKKLSRTAEAILGLKEIRGYLAGQYDLAEAKELLKKNTRRFAKRQLTWFRADKRIRWFDTTRMLTQAIVKAIVKEYKKEGPA